MRYYRHELRRRRRRSTPGDERQAVPDVHARVVDAWLENDAGERVENVEQGEPIGLERGDRGARGARRPRSSRSTY